MTQVVVNGAALMTIRIQQGKSQRALAREVGISSGYLSDVEAEKKIPSPGVAKRLADALGCPMAAFYRVTERPAHAAS